MTNPLAPAGAVSIVTLCRVWVPGTPRTKGHLDVVNAGGTTKTGKRRAAHVEESPESVRWRMMIVDRVRQDMRAREALPAHYYSQTGQPDPEYPYLGPVGVTAQFFQPITPEQLDEGRKVAGSGDLDTLMRNVLDALSVNKKDPAKGAGLIRDDMQVTTIAADKFAAADPGHAGLQLHVWYRHVNADVPH